MSNHYYSKHHAMLLNTYVPKVFREIKTGELDDETRICYLNYGKGSISITINRMHVHEPKTILDQCERIFKDKMKNKS
jgi:hypothetical protein